MDYTLSDLNGDKALGMNGLTIAFWQCNWDTIKEDVMRMFRDFHETSKFVMSLNTTFIVMIPKKRRSIIFQGFSPY